MKIKRALLSVSDKTGMGEFGGRLKEMGVEMVSTGGTAALLKSESIPVVEIEKFTAFPEILGGGVKTLHQKVHGGLLHIGTDRVQQEELAKNGIQSIELVAVNLYPFEQTIRKPDIKLEDAIEQIDIGGPSMLRSAAKNYRFVTTISDPKDYETVLQELQTHGGETTLALREQLAIKVFLLTARYDSSIAAYLNREQATSGSYAVSLPLETRLRYGENPHQSASLYGRFGDFFQKLHGKELSFNNILDINAAANLIREFSEPTVAILKHTNPCGVGSDPDLREAWIKAFATDKQAPFGGIIICNRPMTEALARAIAEIFSEVIIAPDFEPEARPLLQKKKNLRLMKSLQWFNSTHQEPDVRSVIGGLLVQQKDFAALPRPEDHVLTQRPPTADDTASMLFRWNILQHLKSNAIVYARKDRTLGIGAGQMARVDASRIAIWKAGEAGLSLNVRAVPTAAFFPFPDGLIAAADAGATAAIQPGGSVRDEAVIQAANERNVAMVFTGIRNFRH